MKVFAAFALMLVAALPATCVQTGSIPSGRDRLVRFTMVNMSSEPRELHHHGEKVPLPVATRVALQIPAGDSIEITSPTNSKVKETFAVQTTDEGRLMNIR